MGCLSSGSGEKSTVENFHLLDDKRLITIIEKKVDSLNGTNSKDKDYRILNDDVNIVRKKLFYHKFLLSLKIVFYIMQFFIRD